MVAENAWTPDNLTHLSNVAVTEVVVQVLDVPDSPPYWLQSPPITVLPETARPGDVVASVKAYDGDFANPRWLRYGLNPEGLPYSNFFSIHPDTGVITLRKDLNVSRSLILPSAYLRI